MCSTVRGSLLSILIASALPWAATPVSGDQMLVATDASGAATVRALPDGAVAIEITDDGPGIPEKAVDRLFQPFAGSAKPGGSGLGLAIADELVRAHGGALTLARNAPGSTMFRIVLPRRMRAAGAAAE